MPVSARARWVRRLSVALSVIAVYSVSALTVVGAEPNEGSTTALTTAQSHIAVGGLHTCARLSSGEVQCWGSNDQGQLGNGTIVTSTTPVTAVGVTTATAVTAGNNHSCALLGDGTGRCWGLDANGQLGDNSTGATGTQLRTSPVSVSGLSGATALAAGGFHTCAIVGAGTVKCWGDDGMGQLGDGTPGDRSLVPATVAGITTAIAITAGEFHTCALLADGAIKCWGHNGFGQLGDGTMTDRSTPVAVAGLPASSDDPVRALTSGYGHTCALLEDDDGTARCWGDNAYGQLGHETPLTADPDDFGAMEPSTVPLEVQYDSDPSPFFQNLQTLEGVTTLSAGQFHACARMTDGTARCWGQNGRGQLGTDPNPLADGLQDSSSAVPVSGLGASSAVTAGGFHTCAVVGTGMSCWGYNFYGQLGSFAAESLVPVQVTAVTGATAVTAGTGFACALIDGASPAQPVCWGSNADGRLGAGLGVPNTTIRTPVSGIATADAIEAGNAHACASPTGSGVTRCWGLGDSGQLGNGAGTSSGAPVDVSALSGATGVSAGGSLGSLGEGGHTCAVRPDSTLACWGRNLNGQLADNTADNRTSPVTVQADTDELEAEVSLADLTGATAVVTGGFHSCALVSDGTVWCWGANGSGQLGDNTIDERHYAVHVQTDTDQDDDVPLSGVVGLAAGKLHTCALIGSGVDTGKVKCWGAGGQLGDGGGSRSRPTTPATGIGTSAATRAELLIAGDLHTCARLADGSLKCWGENGDGQLGDGTTTDRPVPAQVAAAPSTEFDFGPTDGDVPSEVRPVIRSISASRRNTCAVVLDTTVYCWGDNTNGQLGDGVGPTSVAPVAVTGLAGSV